MTEKRALEDADNDHTKKAKVDVETLERVLQHQSDLEKRLKVLEAKVAELDQRQDDKGKEVIDGKDKNDASKEENKESKEESKEEETPKATFGAQSFQIAPVVITPQTSFEVPTVPNSTKSTPGPVFGQTTTFGSKSFGSGTKFSSPIDHSSKKNVFEEEKKSSFGSNTRFANALQNQLKKKSFLDDPASDVKSSEPMKPQFKQVDLEKTEITTGEENEVSTFNATCKLFELDLTKVSEGWKERGVGPVHVNQSKGDAASARIVMRSNGLLRVVLNYKIQPNTKLMLGLESSLTPSKYLRLNSVGSSGNPSQYLLKFANEKVRMEFVNAVETAKADLA